MSKQLNATQIFSVDSRNSYPTRRAPDISLIRANTEQMKGSFLPLAVQEWKNLTAEQQTLTTPAEVKQLIYKKPAPPRDVGTDRITSIHFTRLRCPNSNLKLNLFNKLMSDSARCECDNDDESTYHYFMQCNLDDAIRINACDNLPPNHWNIDNILYGNITMKICNIQQAALSYVQQTGRFD